MTSEEKTLLFMTKALTYLGKEAVVHVECRQTSNELYLPENWDVKFITASLEKLHKFLKGKYGIITDFDISIYSIEEFLDLFCPKEQTIKIVDTMRKEFKKASNYEKYTEFIDGNDI